MTYAKIQVKEIFADNTIIGFSPHNYQVVFSSNANTVSINMGEIILNFFTI